MDGTSFKNVDIATFDQFDAEDREAAELCPLGKNRKLWRMDGISAALKFLIQRADIDDRPGPVPVVRLNLTSASACERDGDNPIGRLSVISYCTACNDPTGFPVPFWINCGPVVAQMDLCLRCAEYAIEHLGGEPQIGSPTTA